MKQHYFFKFDPKINQAIGCPRATLILSILEYWSTKKPEGFYKFMEPCSHRLYKKGDSWAEELGCERRSFARSFKKIGVKYNSRMDFENSSDTFQGKMYASYYDRYTNRTFFIRNHDVANEFLKDFLPQKNPTTKKEAPSFKPAVSVPDLPLSTDHNGLSYIDAKNTTNDLSKDKSHASDDIIKKMIDIWTAIVQEGRGQIELTGKLIAFLKKALTDKFNDCLQKWKEYCTSIARSKFLMGEKTSFKATLDWALKFESIHKILSGNYGIGDRTPKATLAGYADLHGEILASVEPQEIKDFRILCLETVGNAKYISYFKNLYIEFREGGGIALISPHKFAADDLERNCYSYLRFILQGFSESLKTITVLAPGETIGRLVERERGGGAISSVPQVSMLGDVPRGEPSLEETASEDETLLENKDQRNKLSRDLGGAPAPSTLPEPTKIAEAFIEKSTKKVPSFEDEGSGVAAQVTLETQMLRKKLRQALPPSQFPSWLSTIEVEGISQDGKIVVTLGDSLAVEWCRSRFSKEIFQSAESIWSGVNSLVIREKVSDNIPLSLDKLPKKSENILEKSTLEQAIQSFLSVCSPGRMSETLGMQGDCQAFG